VYSTMQSACTRREPRARGDPCGRTRARAAMWPRVHVARIQRLATASLKRTQSTRVRPSALTRRSPGPVLTPLTTALLWFSLFFFLVNNVQIPKHVKRQTYTNRVQLLSFWHFTGSFLERQNIISKGNDVIMAKQKNHGRNSTAS
jgi:hypothetical protein